MDRTKAEAVDDAGHHAERRLRGAVIYRKRCSNPRTASAGSIGSAL
jgi:hypothetical protein